MTTDSAETDWNSMASLLLPLLWLAWTDWCGEGVGHRGSHPQVPVLRK